MARLILAGGAQRAAGMWDRNHSLLFDEALLVVLDTETGACERLLSHRDAAAECGGDVRAVGHVFKGLSRRPEGWLACTQRAVLWLRSNGDVERRWSSPWLNDAHHALEHDEALWVASTGLDAVLEVRDQSVTVHPLHDEVASDVDYRCADRRPHKVHPNHLFVRGERLWVSCLHDMAARCLSDGTRWQVANERIHDGVVHEGLVWFTTVDGRLLGVSKEGTVVRWVSLRDLHDGSSPLGWCRGLAISDGVAWVGFTRLRATPWRQNLAWIRGAARGWQVATRRPTHVIGVELKTGVRVAAWSPESVGMHAIFGLGCEP